MNEPFNRSLLKENVTGDWFIATSRIRRGDLMFLLLPSPGHALADRRQLRAGIVRFVAISPRDPGRKVVQVDRFVRLADVVGSLQDFLNGKLPLANNRVLEVWRRGGDMPDTAEFERAVGKAMKMSASARRRKLAAANPLPKRISVIALAFERNPYVVAETLLRANGICERCIQPAPFVGRSKGTPYLEVHHRKQLSAGGEDTVANTEALCPNCHREQHHGVAGV
jgi:HNH endonuclease